MLRTCYGHGLTKGAIIQIFYDGLDNPTQRVLNARGIFLYNTPNKVFQILEDKVLLKFDFSDDSQINPKLKIVFSTDRSNINPDHAILMEKFEALATKIDCEFLIIRKELKEMRDDRRDNHASQIYMKVDTPMCEPLEANYVQGYHGGYHDRKPIDSYSYPNPNSNYSPQNKMPHTSRYFKLPKTLTKEMMREMMTRKMEANERMEDQGDVKFIEEDEIKHIPTISNLNLINSNSPTLSSFLKDCTMHIPYTNAKTFADDSLPNHVGDKELSLIDGVGTRKMTKKNDNAGNGEEDAWR
ncbi:hypothetical protein Tco_1575429 [Tanacetum coccineum]